uniref:Uncharacterized protein n=1 Tax=Lotus japonicus TaxID=34305 RepID=I3S3R3_LOTJA|nr:unknown [Lotus japonicus]
MPKMRKIPMKLAMTQMMLSQRRKLGKTVLMPMKRMYMMSSREFEKRIPE